MDIKVMTKTSTSEINKVIKILFSIKTKKLFRESLKVMTRKASIPIKAKVKAEMDLAFLYPNLK